MKVTEKDLQAYVDDRLEPERRRAVESYLAQAGDDAARLTAYREQNAGLHRLYDAVLDEPVPDRLRQIRIVQPQPRPWFAAACLLVGVVIGWFAHALIAQRPPFQQSLPRQAAIAHAVYAPEVRHPVEVGANEQEHLVNWLSKRLGTRLKAPLLSAEGYELVGGRLLPGGAGGPVAQLMYQDAKGKRLTLYVSPLATKSSDTAFRFSQEDRVAVFYWIDASLGYALSGELPREELLRIANTVYKQLNP
jgi:anti-sigma factor RsiW